MLGSSVSMETLRCGKQTVPVSKDGFYSADRCTRVCPYCEKQTIDIIGANWTPADNMHLF